MVNRLKVGLSQSDRSAEDISERKREDRILTYYTLKRRLQWCSHLGCLLFRISRTWGCGFESYLGHKYVSGFLFQEQSGVFKYGACQIHRSKIPKSGKEEVPDLFYSQADKETRRYIYNSLFLLPLSKRVWLKCYPIRLLCFCYEYANNLWSAFFTFSCFNVYCTSDYWRSEVIKRCYESR
jgi:hypothetical protein